MFKSKKKERTEFLNKVEAVGKEYDQERISRQNKKIQVSQGMIQYFCPCGCGLFRETNRLGKVSGIITGNGQPGLAIIKVFVCESCERETNEKEILSLQMDDTLTVTK